MTHEDEFATHPLTSLQENLTAAATRIAAAIENARAARIPGIAELIDLRAANEAKSGSTESIYVSPDWPSAEAYAKNRIAIS